MAITVEFARQALHDLIRNHDAKPDVEMIQKTVSGHYEIDAERELVRHLLEGELFPGGHSKILERRYRFEGDLMSLKPVDGTNREILWQRVHTD